jgi:hypothetical protein
LRVQFLVEFATQLARELRELSAELDAKRIQVAPGGEVGPSDGWQVAHEVVCGSAADGLLEVLTIPSRCSAERSRHSVCDDSRRVLAGVPAADGFLLVVGGVRRLGGTGRGP